MTASIEIHADGDRWRGKGGRYVCGSKCRKDRDGEQRGKLASDGVYRCSRSPTKGFARCRAHGGVEGVGGTIKHGRYSKALQERAALQRLFEAAREDAELLRLEPRVAVLDARATELLENLAAVIRPDWSAARDAFLAAGKAMTEGDTAGFDAHYKRLGKMLREGASYESCWAKAADAVERVAQLSVRAREVEAKEQRVVTEREYRTTLAQILDLIIEEAGQEAGGRMVDRIRRSVFQLN